MIEIKVPADPPGAPEQLFLGSLIGYVNREPRLAKPLSQVALGIRLIDAAESAKSTGALTLTDGDHKSLCSLLETAEISLVELFEVNPETQETKPIQVNPLLERAYVALILRAKPAEPEAPDQAAE